MPKPASSAAQEPPDLTDRYRTVLDRLESASIGPLTFKEFRMIEGRLKHRSIGPFRIHHAFENIAGDRYPERERSLLEELEAIANKCGV